MRRLKAGIIILVFLVALVNFPVNGQETGVCCEKKGDSFCSFTSDSGSCDTGSSAELGRNYRSEFFACSQIDSCKPVCCVDSSGKCLAQMSKVQCLAQGGLPKEGGDCSALSDCSIGSCVIQNQCSAGLTALECRLKAETLGLDYEFSSQYKTVNECYTHLTKREGCCVTGDNQCARTSADICSGEFYPNKLCSSNEFVGQCDNQRMDHKGCGPGGEDVYWYDSGNQLENVVGVPYDGSIKYEANGVGDCDLSKGNVCGKSNDEYQCVDINCDVGDTFSVDEYNPVTKETVFREITVTKPMLGDSADKRKNGESWCSVSYYDQGVSDINSHAVSFPAKYSPGARHYVRSCVLGKIVVEACDTERNTVCRDSTQEISGEIFNNAACVKNRAESCIKYGGDDDLCKKNDFCTLETSGYNECRPKARYTLAGSKYCGKSDDQGCGEGWWNQCDSGECYSFGDCSFKDDISTWEGALIGGITAATIVAGGQLMIDAVGAGSFGQFFGKVGKGAKWVGGKPIEFFKFLFDVGGDDSGGGGEPSGGTLV